MDLGAILLLIALLIGVGLFLAAPLLRGAAGGMSQGIPEVSSLMAERDRIISALQELDFDFKLGKIPAEDYPAQRGDLLQKGAEILRKLDALAPTPSAATDTLSDAGSRLEEAVAAGGVDASRASSQLGDDQIESMLAARRAARHGKSSGFCPRCGKPVAVTDQFCPNCGKALK